MNTIADNLKVCYGLRTGVYGYEMFEIELNSLKQQGKENTQRFADLKSKIDLQKGKYLNLGCGKDKEMEECLILDNARKGQIEDVSSSSKKAFYDNNNSTEVIKQNLAETKLQFELKGCEKKINQLNLDETDLTISQFENLDIARINEESKYQIQQRVFFGGLVLVTGLVIITMFNGNKK
jgi:hypothetical protein